MFSCIMFSCMVWLLIKHCEREFNEFMERKWLCVKNDVFPVYIQRGRGAMVQNTKENRITNHPIIHYPTSEGVSEVSEQANECAMRANEQTDKRVAQYLCLDSWMFLNHSALARSGSSFLPPSFFPFLLLHEGWIRDACYAYFRCTSLWPREPPPSVVPPTSTPSLSFWISPLLCTKKNHGESQRFNVINV